MADFSDFTTSPGKGNGLAGDDWGEPDMEILRLRRRPPPPLPIEVFGPAWSRWIIDAAAAAACPPDYVAAPLLSSASTLIGHARWAQATETWVEPPHLWTISVGDSGDGKSPGMDTLHREVLPELERRMVGDYPEKLREWKAAAEFDKAAEKQWQENVRAAQRDGKVVPQPPRPIASSVEPQRPRLRQHDVTIEKVALVLATAAPKGLLIVRDEIAGWIDGMATYNPAGRAFWIESYGGRPYRVERVKHPDPIEIPRLAVAVNGGTQPERLEKLLTAADDGLIARMQWFWPDPVPFELAEETPGTTWAITALDRLRELDLQSGDPPRPVFVPLIKAGRAAMREFGREMQARRTNAGGLLRSAFGKARGSALRISLTLEWLWWCAKDDFAMPPTEISLAAFEAAAALVDEYLLPMAERVFGDAVATANERNAAALARWIIKERPAEVHIRDLQRNVRLPGLRTSQLIKLAANALVEADWLRPPVKTVFGQPRHTVSYSVNPKLMSG
jgi:hypothetical protein